MTCQESTDRAYLLRLHNKDHKERNPSKTQADHWGMGSERGSEVRDGLLRDHQITKGPLLRSFGHDEQKEHHGISLMLQHWLL